MFRVTEDDGGNQTDERANAPTRSTARRIGFWFGVGLILAGLSMVAYVGWQLYGTNWVAKKHQKELTSQVQEDWAAGDGCENGEMMVDRAGKIGLARHEAVVDVADAPVQRVQRPQRVHQERLAGRLQHQCVDAAVDVVEFVEGQAGAALAQQALDVQRLIAVRQAGAIGREPDDKALHVAAQGQQHALARQVDRRDVQAVARADDDEGIGREAIDGDSFAAVLAVREP